MRKLYFCLLFLLFSSSLTIKGYSEATHKAIVFDFGGVMAYSDKTIFYNFIKQSFQLDDASIITVRDQFQASLKAKIPEMFFWKQLANQLQITLPEEWEDQYDAAISSALYEIPGMRALVKSYKEQGFQIALLSNVQARQANFLKTRGYYNDFDPLLLSCEIGVDKPDPRTYQILLETLKIEPQNCIFIDDKRENINAAKALGIDAILFLSCDQIREELRLRLDFQ